LVIVPRSPTLFCVGIYFVVIVSLDVDFTVADFMTDLSIHAFEPVVRDTEVFPALFKEAISVFLSRLWMVLSVVIVLMDQICTRTESDYLRR